MKQIINKLKNKDIDVLFMIIVIVSILSFGVPLNSGDELWNFANAYKMFNGYKIYEELNVIITPLFFYIAQIFFLIFEPTMLSFRIYNVAIYFLFFVLIYFIFKALEIPRRRSVFYTFIVLLIFNTMIPTGANYNILVMIPILVTILLIIKGKENTIFIGILLFVTFILKQNVSIYFAIGILVHELTNNRNTKNRIMRVLKIYLTTLVGIVFFLIYMYLDNNLYNFINYCFLGVGEFGTNNLAIEMTGARYMYISIMVIILTFVILNNKKINKNLNKEFITNIKCLLSIGLPLILTAFPIVNYYHATLSSTIIIIEFLYIIEKNLIENIEIKKEKIFYIAIIIIYTLYLYGAFFINLNKKDVVLIKDGIFYACMTDQKEYEEIDLICEYIKEQNAKNIDVKILSYNANLYMIKLNKNNGIFDLAFLGNLGLGGEETLIDQIRGLENTIILIQTDEQEMFWQESKKARDYITNNYKKIGEIQEYSAYYIER